MYVFCQLMRMEEGRTFLVKWLQILKNLSVSEDKRGKRILHLQGGRTPLYNVQMSQGITHSHMLPDQR